MLHCEQRQISIFHQARNKCQCCLEFRVMFRVELHMFFPTTFSKVTQITYRARIMYKATKKADGDKEENQLLSLEEIRKIGK